MSLSSSLTANQFNTRSSYANGSNGVSYSTKRISTRLIRELSEALKSIDSYGSVEIYVQNSTVTQITTRNIKKTQSPARAKIQN